MSDAKRLKTQHHTVRITCSPTGRFSYGRNEHLRVRKGDDIDWTCTSGRFAIHFVKKNATPVNHRSTTTPMRNAHARKNGVIEGTVRTRARGRGKRYEYCVAAEVNGKIFIDDPDIIVF